MQAGRVVVVVGRHAVHMQAGRVGGGFLGISVEARCGWPWVARGGWEGHF